MPTISIFYGVVIQMFWNEHGVPHFHALYAEYEAVIGIEALALEWAMEHRQELLDNWNLCRDLQHPNSIEPLR